MEMDTFFVYVLQSLKDYSFYIGECDDLDKRMSKHFEGLSKYSATKRPWRLVYFEKAFYAYRSY
jgi:putative endonuclease